MKKSYFKNPYKELMTTAKLFGLCGVENHHLTSQGLLAKLEEWNKKEGGVEKYVYDLTQDKLREEGISIPTHIIRGEPWEWPKPCKSVRYVKRLKTDNRKIKK